MRAQERVGLARFEVTEGTRENRCARTTNASDSCFTGKEEDIDVGLTYFGKRYLSPYLNRWISADPLTVHGLGADLNLYAYVSGEALLSTDPVGLDKTQAESLRELDSGVRTNGKWNIDGPSAIEPGHEPPAPMPYIGVKEQVIHGQAPRSGEVSRAGSRPGEEVLVLLGEVGIGAAKGAGVTAVVSAGCAVATGPMAPACMAGVAGYGGYSLWRDRKRILSDPHEAADVVGATVAGPGVLKTAIELPTARVANVASAGGTRGASVAQSLLERALRRQGLDSPPAGLKETWSEGGFDYEVRIHPADPAHGKMGSILRAARRKQGTDAQGQGFGWEYVDDEGTWHHTSTLKPGKPGNPNPRFNSEAARKTHIPVETK